MKYLVREFKVPLEREGGRGGNREGEELVRKREDRGRKRKRNTLQEKRTLLR